MGVRITGWGKALPERVVTNGEMSTIVDTSDEWIVERTGIKARRVAVEESGTDLASAAASAALERAGLSPDDIDLIVCMTITPDAIIPAQACMIKARIGASHAVGFDLNAACSGCIYGIDVASRMIEGSAMAGASSGVHVGNAMRKALVIGVERLSRIVDWTDRGTCVLFGDGAGAVVLEWEEDAQGILASFLKNTDDDTLALSCDAVYDTSTFPFGDLSEPRSVFELMDVAAEGEDGSAYPPFHAAIGMNGQRVFKFATAAMVEGALAVCGRAGVPMEEVSCLVPHQANDRIIRFAAKKLGIPYEKCQVSIAEVGNTSASSVLMALTDAFESGRISTGDYVMLVGFGAGLTSGALLFRA